MLVRACYLVGNQGLDQSYGRGLEGIILSLEIAGALKYQHLFTFFFSLKNEKLPFSSLEPVMYQM